MATEHTPTPWAANTISGIIINGPGNECAAVAQGGSQAEANAAFIVRCVNSHEALVKALEASGRMLREMQRYASDDQADTIDDVQDNSSAALRLAKGAQS